MPPAHALATTAWAHLTHIYIYIYGLFRRVIPISVKDCDVWIPFTNDLLIVVNTCVDPATIFGEADNGEMVHWCITDFPNRQLWYILNSEFFLLLDKLHTKRRKLGLSCHLTLRRRDELISFSRWVAQSEAQTASLRIWTHIYHHYHHHLYIYIYI